MEVLLVEDDRRLAEVIASNLADEGYVVSRRYDDAEAVAAAVSDRYEIIVLDVLLPTFDGFEVARRLRLAGVACPILMLTARDTVADRVAGLDAGADDYLVKPFALAELLARMRALLRRTRSGNDVTRLVVGDMELDLLGRQVIRQGRRIDLTAKEFALLEELMRHPGEVMSRSRLLDHVWSYDILTESNMVDLYIHYLRNKIDRDFMPKRLRTVRGRGYVLRPG
ncbi:MAG TPA: response regulator transcription factor [Tepidiformaceae bacterium]|nr:response regulator transcription factor [Tepidiformaceae bacterium]